MAVPPVRRDGDDIEDPAAPAPVQPQRGLVDAIRNRFGSAWRAFAAAARAARAWTARLVVGSLRFTLLHGTLAAISLLGGVAVVALAAEYGYHPNRDTAAWGALVPRYAEAGTCASCHEPEVLLNAAAAHAGVTCEACHGPLAGHDGTEAAVAAPGVVADTGEDVVLGPAREAGEPICLTCHEATVGRPDGFPVVSSVTHFPLPACTVCHDPHEPPAVPPPDIRHPLDGLPACTVCHQSDGIRPVPDRHPVWDGDCRACHRSAQPLGA